jgi:hypothetical protein
MFEDVRTWLTSQGFPLEMRTASAFRKAGFEVRQSVLYRDAETGKSREMDILAIDPDIRGILRIHFVIECEATKKPWLLLCSPNTLDGYNRLFSFAVSSRETKAALSDRLPEIIAERPWLRKPGLTGFSLRQAFSENDLAYAAALSLAKATDDLVNRDRDKYTARLCLAFPIIVVESPLIRCDLAEDGEVLLEEVDQGEFLFHADPPKGFGTYIRVVTANQLTAFAIEAKQVQTSFGLT